MPTFPTVTCHQCVTGLFCSLIGVSNLLTLGCDIAIYSEHCRTDYTRDPCNQVTINNQRKVSVLSKFTIMCRITFRVNPGYKSATGVHTCNSLSHSLLYQHDFMTVTEVLSSEMERWIIYWECSMLFQRTQPQSPAPTWGGSQQPVTLDPGDLMSSFGLQGHLYSHMLLTTCT